MCDARRIRTRGPSATLAHTFIEEYLAQAGYTFETIGKLPPEQLKQLMVKASVYASMKLAEIKERADMVISIHHATESLT